MSGFNALKSVLAFFLTIIIIISSLVTTFAVEGEQNDSSPNGEEIEITYLETPTLKKPKNTEKGVEVLWKSVSGAKGYKVFVKKNDIWEEIGFTLTNSFIDENVVSGETYTYTVCCVDEDGVTHTSLYDETGKSIKYMEVPQIRSFNNAAGGTEIKWHKVSGAAKYYIYRQVDGKWKYLGSSKTTSYLHKITQNNSSYIYSLRSEDVTGLYKSGYATTGASNTYLSAPVLKKTKNTANGIRVYWDKVEGAQKYKVFVKTDKTWKAIGTTKSNNFTHKDVISGKNYKYTVRCVSNDTKNYQSYYDKNGISAVFIGVPQNIKFSNVVNGTKITWKAVTGADKYKVYIKNGNAWKYLGSSAKTEYLHKISAKNVVCIYSVIASNTKNNFSSARDTNGAENRFIAPVPIASVTYKNGGYVIKWGKEENVSKYRIYRKTPSSSWVKLAEVRKAQYTDKTAKKTGTYTYAIRCLNEKSKLISALVADNKFYNNGELAVNRILGGAKGEYYYVDNTGVKCTDEEIQLAVDYIMKYSTGSTPEEKFKSTFMYMATKFPYKRSYDHPKKAADIAPLAIDIFRNKQGNCFRQAAATACLARVCGFRARVVTGLTASRSGGFVPHGWTEVYYNGKWRVCDMNANMKYSYPRYYMLNYHYWTIKPQYRYEVTVSNGKSVWK